MSIIEYVKSHPVESATAGVIILGYIAKWTANAKSKIGQAIHNGAVKLSTKIGKK